MKKIFSYLFVIVLFSFGTVYGQFQVTSYFNPRPGESQILIQADTVGVFPGNGGANQTWNFSSLINSGDTNVQIYVLPSSTPYGSSFPSATVAVYAPTNPTAFSYFSGSSSALELVGNQNSYFKSIGVDPKKFRVYPFNYQQTFTDTYRGIVLQGTDTVQKSSGNISVIYDGYGTITLPSGTASNVARFKFISYEVDTMFFGSTTMIEYIKDTLWIWSKSNYRYALLNIEKSWMSIDGINYSAFKWVGYVPNINWIGVSNVSNEIPANFKLEQNYPNPFNPTTTIRYQIPKNAFVTIKIYDNLGREIETLCEGNHNAGIFEVNWNANGYSSGVYYCRMTTGDFSDTKQLVLLK